MAEQTIAQWRTQARQQLPTEMRHEADMLLQHLLGVNRAWLFTHDDAVLTNDQHIQLNKALARCLQGEPLAYVLGEWSFYGLDFFVTPDVLIPRADTELLVDTVLSKLRECSDAEKGLRILDLGTGSGAIAVSLAKHLPQATVVAVDASEAALAVAARNAKRHAVTVQFHHSDWFSALTHQAAFDFIVSNPPYLPDDDPHLPTLQHEPLTALVAGDDDGLADIRTIAKGARAFLKPSGWLMLEHGMSQGDAVREVLQQAGFIKVRTMADMEHRPRMTLGQFG